MSDNNHQDMMEVKMILGEIKSDVKYLKEEKHRYVTKEEFKPVKSVVFGIVGLILMSSLGAIISRVIVR